MARFSSGRDAALFIFVAALMFLGGVIHVASVVWGVSRGVCVRFVDELDRPLSGVDVYVQVWAVDPNAAPSTVDVYCGRLVGSELFISAGNSAFRRVLDCWNGLYPKDSRYETFLGVFIWVVVGDNVLIYPPIVVNYNPLLASRSIVSKTIKVNVYRRVPEGLEPYRAAQIGMRMVGSASAPPIYMYIRNDSLSWESGGYIKVPILIVHNRGLVSGVIASGITISNSETIGFRLSVGYGLNISSKWYRGENPSISFQISDATRTGRYCFSRAVEVAPNDKWYYWIMAKAAHIHYRLALVDPSTGQVIFWMDDEMMLDYIHDVQVSGSNIVGDVSPGNPPYEGRILEGSVNEKLTLPNTVLADGKLNVGETIQFNEIFDIYDAYNVDFEIGIPVGAIAAAFMGNLPAAALQTISGATVSLSCIRSYDVFIGGCLTNFGQKEGRGSNIPETIYMRISKFRYRAPNGYLFKVPMGIYFRCGD